MSANARNAAEDLDHCHVTDKSDRWRQEDCPIACIKFNLV